MIETHIDCLGTINGGYEPGRPARLRQRRQLRQATTSISDAGNTVASTGIELRSEVDGRGPARRSPQARRCRSAPTDIWLRLTKDGRQLRAASTRSTARPGRRSRSPVTNPMVDAGASASSRSGVQQTAGRHGRVRLLHGQRLGSAARSPPPENAPPAINAGHGHARRVRLRARCRSPSAVDATDADAGDALTYSVGLRRRRHRRLDRRGPVAHLRDGRRLRGRGHRVRR